MIDLNADPWYISSTGEGLALRIKAALIGILPLALIALKYFHVEIGEGEIRTFIDQLSQIIIDVTAVLSGLLFIYGQLRAWYYKFKNRSI